MVVEASPPKELVLWNLGLPLHFEGRFAEAEEQYRRAIGVDVRSHWAHMLPAWSLGCQRRYADAETELHAATRLNNNPPPLAMLGHVYGVSGGATVARKIAAELGGLVPEPLHVAHADPRFQNLLRRIGHRA